MNRGLFPLSTVEFTPVRATIQQNRNPRRRRSSGASLTSQPVVRFTFGSVGFYSSREG
jgi:hypothetical protein